MGNSNMCCSVVYVLEAASTRRRFAGMPELLIGLLITGDTLIFVLSFVWLAISIRRINAANQKTIEPSGLQEHHSQSSVSPRRRNALLVIFVCGSAGTFIAWWAGPLGGPQLSIIGVALVLLAFLSLVIVALRPR
jgi:hypothetical protein